MCQIYTDVNGLYSSDPRLVSEARQIPRINYKELLTFSARGAKIIHPRSVEIALNYSVPLEILSTFEESSCTKGTQIIKEEVMENFRVKGITLENNIAHFSLKDLHMKNFDSYEFFSTLNAKNIPIDMIYQNMDEHTIKEVSFTTEKKHYLDVINTCEKYLNKESKKLLTTSKNQSIVSVIGYGINKHPEITTEIFKVLKNYRISIRQISTSESSISFVMNSEKSPYALNLLHKIFI